MHIMQTYMCVVYTYTHIHTVHKSTCMQTYMCVVYTYTHIHTVHKSTCMQTYMCVVYTYIHIHTVHKSTCPRSIAALVHAVHHEPAATSHLTLHPPLLPLLPLSHTSHLPTAQHSYCACQRYYTIHTTPPFPGPAVHAPKATTAQ